MGKMEQESDRWSEVQVVSVALEIKDEVSFANASGRNKFPVLGRWVSLRDRSVGSDIEEEVKAKPLLLHVEKSQ